MKMTDSQKALIIRTLEMRLRKVTKRIPNTEDPTVKAEYEAEAIGLHEILKLLREPE